MSITKLFIDYFVEISNKLSIFSRVVDHRIFQKEKIDKQEEMNWMLEVGFLKTFTQCTIPRTMKAKILLAKEKFIEKYDCCVQLHGNRSCYLMNEIFKTELGSIRNNVNTNKTIIIAKRLRNEIEKSNELENIEKESQEIQVVTQYIDMIITLSKEYRKPERSITKIKAYEKKIKINLEDYVRFLENEILPLMKAIRYDEDNFKIMSSLSVPNLFDQEVINPFFMFLVYDSIDERTKYRIKNKQKNYLFWNEFRLSLELYKEIQLQKKADEQERSVEIRFSNKIPPGVLFQLIKERRQKASINLDITFVAKKNEISESYLRQWLTTNAFYYPKFKNKRPTYIVNNLNDEDVIPWFQNLGKIDKQFNRQLEEYKKM